nr:MAG: hypothetical protein [Nairoviridae sp.]
MSGDRKSSSSSRRSGASYKSSQDHVTDVLTDCVRDAMRDRDREKKLIKEKIELILYEAMKKTNFFRLNKNKFIRPNEFGEPTIMDHEVLSTWITDDIASSKVTATFAEMKLCKIQSDIITTGQADSVLKLMEAEVDKFIEKEIEEALSKLDEITVIKIKSSKTGSEQVAMPKANMICSKIDPKSLTECRRIAVSRLLREHNISSLNNLISKYKKYSCCIKDKAGCYQDHMMMKQKIDTEIEIFSDLKTKRCMKCNRQLEEVKNVWINKLIKYFNIASSVSFVTYTESFKVFAEQCVEKKEFSRLSFRIHTTMNLIEALEIINNKFTFKVERHTDEDTFIVDMLNCMTDVPNLFDPIIDRINFLKNDQVSVVSERLKTKVVDIIDEIEKTLTLEINFANKPEHEVRKRNLDRFREWIRIFHQYFRAAINTKKLIELCKSLIGGLSELICCINLNVRWYHESRKANTKNIIKQTPNYKIMKSCIEGCGDFTPDAYRYEFSVEPNRLETIRKEIRNPTTDVEAKIRKINEMKVINNRENMVKKVIFYEFKSKTFEESQTNQIKTRYSVIEMICSDLFEVEVCQKTVSDCKQNSFYETKFILIHSKLTSLLSAICNLAGEPTSSDAEQKNYVCFNDSGITGKSSVVEQSTVEKILEKAFQIMPAMCNEDLSNLDGKTGQFKFMEDFKNNKPKFEELKTTHTARLIGALSKVQLTEKTKLLNFDPNRFEYTLDSKELPSFIPNYKITNKLIDKIYSGIISEEYHEEVKDDDKDPIMRFPVIMSSELDMKEQVSFASCDIRSREDSFSRHSGYYESEQNSESEMDTSSIDSSEPLFNKAGDKEHISEELKRMSKFDTFEPLCVVFCGYKPNSLQMNIRLLLQTLTELMCRVSGLDFRVNWHGKLLKVPQITTLVNRLKRIRNSLIKNATMSDINQMNTLIQTAKTVFDSIVKMKEQDEISEEIVNDSSKIVLSSRQFNKMCDFFKINRAEKEKFTKIFESKLGQINPMKSLIKKMSLMMNRFGYDISTNQDSYLDFSEMDIESMMESIKTEGDLKQRIFCSLPCHDANPDGKYEDEFNPDCLFCVESFNMVESRIESESETQPNGKFVKNLLRSISSRISTDKSLYEKVKVTDKGKLMISDKEIRRDPLSEKDSEIDRQADKRPNLDQIEVTVLKLDENFGVVEEPGTIDEIPVPCRFEARKFDDGISGDLKQEKESDAKRKKIADQEFETIIEINRLKTELSLTLDVMTDELERITGMEISEMMKKTTLVGLITKVITAVETNGKYVPKAGFVPARKLKMGRKELLQALDLELELDDSQEADLVATINKETCACIGLTTEVYRLKKFKQFLEVCGNKTYKFSNMKEEKRIEYIKMKERIRFADRVSKAVIEDPSIKNRMPEAVKEEFSKCSINEVDNLPIKKLIPKLTDEKRSRIEECIEGINKKISMNDFMRCYNLNNISEIVGDLKAHLQALKTTKSNPVDHVLEISEEIEMIIRTLCSTRVGWIVSLMTAIGNAHFTHSNNRKKPGKCSLIRLDLIDGFILIQTREKNDECHLIYSDDFKEAEYTKFNGSITLKQETPLFNTEGDEVMKLILNDRPFYMNDRLGRFYRSSFGMICSLIALVCQSENCRIRDSIEKICPMIPYFTNISRNQNEILQNVRYNYMNGLSETIELKELIDKSVFPCHRTIDRWYMDRSISVLKNTVEYKRKLDKSNCYKKDFDQFPRLQYDGCGLNKVTNFETIMVDMYMCQLYEKHLEDIDSAYWAIVEKDLKFEIKRKGIFESKCSFRGDCSSRCHKDILGNNRMNCCYTGRKDDLSGSDFDLAAIVNEPCVGIPFKFNQPHSAEDLCCYCSRLEFRLCCTSCRNKQIMLGFPRSYKEECWHDLSAAAISSDFKTSSGSFLTGFIAASENKGMMPGYSAIIRDSDCSRGLSHLLNTNSIIDGISKSFNFGTAIKKLRTNEIHQKANKIFSGKNPSDNVIDKAISSGIFQPDDRENVKTHTSFNTRYDKAIKNLDLNDRVEGMSNDDKKILLLFSEKLIRNFNQTYDRTESSMVRIIEETEKRLGCKLVQSDKCYNSHIRFTCMNPSTVEWFRKLCNQHEEICSMVNELGLAHMEIVDELINAFVSDFEEFLNSVTALEVARSIIVNYMIYKSESKNNEILHETDCQNVISLKILDFCFKYRSVVNNIRYQIKSGMAIKFSQTDQCNIKKFLQSSNLREEDLSTNLEILRLFNLTSLYTEALPNFMERFLSSEICLRHDRNTNVANSVLISKSTRTKNLIKVATILNDHGTKGNKSIIGHCSSIISSVPEFYYGTAPKAQFGGPRELAVQSYPTRIINCTSESIIKTINKYIEGEMLSKNNLKSTILEFKIKRGHLYHTSETLVGFSADNSKWGPNHHGILFLSAIMPFEDLLGPLFNLLKCVQYLNCMKAVEIPSSSIKQILHEKINFSDGLSCTNPVKKLLEKYVMMGQNYIIRFFHMMQGIQHHMSSFYGNVCMTFIHRLISEATKANCMFFQQSSDDSSMYWHISHSEGMSHYSNEIEVQTSVISFSRKRMLQLINHHDSPKTARSKYIIEYNSKFAVSGSYFMAKIKFVSTQHMFNLCNSIRSIHLNCFQASKQAFDNGCSLLDCILLYCGCASLYLRQAKMLNGGTNRICRNLFEIPTFLGGLVCPTISGMFVSTEFQELESCIRFGLKTMDRKHCYMKDRMNGFRFDGLPDSLMRKTEDTSLHCCHVHTDVRSLVLNIFLNEDSSSEEPDKEAGKSEQFQFIKNLESTSEIPDVRLFPNKSNRFYEMRSLLNELSEELKIILKSNLSDGNHGIIFANMSHGNYLIDVAKTLRAMNSSGVINALCDINETEYEMSFHRSILHKRINLVDDDIKSKSLMNQIVDWSLSRKFDASKLIKKELALKRSLEVIKMDMMIETFSKEEVSATDQFGNSISKDLETFEFCRLWPYHFRLKMEGLIKLISNQNRMELSAECRSEVIDFIVRYDEFESDDVLRRITNEDESVFNEQSGDVKSHLHEAQLRPKSDPIIKSTTKEILMQATKWNQTSQISNAQTKKDLRLVLNLINKNLNDKLMEGIEIDTNLLSEIEKKCMFLSSSVKFRTSIIFSNREVKTLTLENLSDFVTNRSISSKFRYVQITPFNSTGKTQRSTVLDDLDIMMTLTLGSDDIESKTLLSKLLNENDLANIAYKSELIKQGNMNRETIRACLMSSVLGKTITFQKEVDYKTTIINTRTKSGRLIYITEGPKCLMAVEVGKRTNKFRFICNNIRNESIRDLLEKFIAEIKKTDSTNKKSTRPVKFLEIGDTSIIHSLATSRSLAPNSGITTSVDMKKLVEPREGLKFEDNVTVMIDKNMHPVICHKFKATSQLSVQRTGGLYSIGEETTMTVDVSDCSTLFPENDDSLYSELVKFECQIKSNPGEKIFFFKVFNSLGRTSIRRSVPSNILKKVIGHLQDEACLLKTSYKTVKRESLKEDSLMAELMSCKSEFEINSKFGSRKLMGVIESILNSEVDPGVDTMSLIEQAVIIGDLGKFIDENLEIFGSIICDNKNKIIGMITEFDCSLSKPIFVILSRSFKWKFQTLIRCFYALKLKKTENKSKTREEFNYFDDNPISHQLVETSFIPDEDAEIDNAIDQRDGLFMGETPDDQTLQMMDEIMNKGQSPSTSTLERMKLESAIAVHDQKKLESDVKRIKVDFKESGVLNMLDFMENHFEFRKFQTNNTLVMEINKAVVMNDIINLSTNYSSEVNLITICFLSMCTERDWFHEFVELVTAPNERNETITLTMMEGIIRCVNGANRLLSGNSNLIYFQKIRGDFSWQDFHGESYVNMHMPNDKMKLEEHKNSCDLCKPKLKRLAKSTQEIDKQLYLRVISGHLNFRPEYERIIVIGSTGEEQPPLLEFCSGSETRMSVDSSSTNNQIRSKITNKKTSGLMIVSDGFKTKKLSLRIWLRNML